MRWAMKFIDLFSGIGGFRLGMEMAGHECVGHCEIDKFADKSYRAMYEVKDNEWYASDITRVKPGDLPEADCYCFGFPCQAFSIAGKRGGFADTRGTLFFEVMRLAKERKPRVLFAENVKGLLNHDGGRTFGTIIRTMDELGYDVEWQVLNSANFGVPQNRERVFIIGHLRGESERKVFPFGDCTKETNGIQGQNIGTLTTRTGQSTTVGSYVVESKQHAQVKQIGNIMPTKTRANPNQDRVYDTDGISPCLNGSEGGGRQPYIALPVLAPERIKKRQNGRRFKQNGEPNKHGVAIIQRPRGQNKGGLHNVSPTLSSHSWQENNHLIDGCKIRKLTPKECFRLQGFPDEYYEKAAAVNSDSQLYKQAGNSVTVNVIYEIARRLII